MHRLIYIALGLFCLGLTPNSAKTAESYEVILTKHLTSFQEYPAEAAEYGLEGDAIIRLRINGKGEIVAYALVKAVGNPILDGSIAKMVEAANPAPRPPKNILNTENEVDFMMPIAFRLEPDMQSLIPIDTMFQRKVSEAWEKHQDETP